MNQAHFKEWAVEHLLPSIPDDWGPCLILMDNAPSHNEIVPGKHVPTKSNKLDEIQGWCVRHHLDAASIPRPSRRTNKKSGKPTLTKADYWAAIEADRVVHADRYVKCYLIDQLTAAAGHEIVRLPVGMCDWNMIELMWASLKGSVAFGNDEQTIKRVEELVAEFMSLREGGTFAQPMLAASCYKHTMSEITKHPVFQAALTKANNPPPPPAAQSAPAAVGAFQCPDLFLKRCGHLTQHEHDTSDACSEASYVTSSGADDDSGTDDESGTDVEAENYCCSGIDQSGSGSDSASELSDEDEYVCSLVQQGKEAIAELANLRAILAEAAASNETADAPLQYQPGRRVMRGKARIFSGQPYHRNCGEKKKHAQSVVAAGAGTDKSPSDVPWGNLLPLGQSAPISTCTTDSRTMAPPAKRRAVAATATVPATAPLKPRQALTRRVAATPTSTGAVAATDSRPMPPAKRLRWAPARAATTSLAAAPATARPRLKPRR